MFSQVFFLRGEAMPMMALVIWMSACEGKTAAHEP
jgi:hypothetical protein